MSDILNTSLTGMLAFQQALSMTANNIANANTPGYSRLNLLRGKVRVVVVALSAAALRSRRSSEFTTRCWANNYEIRQPVLRGSPRSKILRHELMAFSPILRPVSVPACNRFLIRSRTFRTTLRRCQFDALCLARRMAYRSVSSLSMDV